jgi:hypothetical protein
VAHHGAVRDDDRFTTTALTQARVFAAHHAPARYQPLHGQDTWRTGADVFRTCWEGPDPKRDFCVFSRKEGSVLVTQADTNQTPNSVEAGGDNPGRIGG